MRQTCLLSALIIYFCCGAYAQAYTVQATVPPTLWGLFFEDINRGADGGLYVELVKNAASISPNP